MIPAFIADSENRKRRSTKHVVLHVDGSSSEEGPKKDETVLEAFGGGGSKTDPNAESAARIREEDAAAEREEKAEERKRQYEEEKARRERGEKLTDTSNNRIRARSGASNYVRSKLAQMGINDEYGISSAYNDAVNAIDATIAEDAGDVSSYFNYDSIWDDVYGSTNNRLRNDYTNRYNEKVTDDYEYKTVADTMDDAIIDAILGSRYEEALGTVNRARDRGQLNESGYNTSLKALDEQKKAGYSQLQGIGGGVLEGYREKLREEEKRHRENISKYEVTQGDLDLDNYFNSLERIGSGFGTSLEGDIYSALGDKTFFDTNKSISRGGASQGSTNASTSNTDLFNQFLDWQKRQQGNTGAF